MTKGDLTMESNQYLSRNFSMGEYLKRKCRQMPRRLACTARDEREWREWRAAFAAKLHELMAPWPEPCPLDPIILERQPCDGYVREKVLFSSEEDMAVPAYVLIPDTLDGPGPHPALICQHGHGDGKDDVVGITHGVFGQWERGQRHNYAYAAALAAQGYIVLAMDARGWGERHPGYEIPSGDDGCNINQIKAQLLGLNTLTLNVFDLRRCIDYLLTRPEVDAERIGCAGLSYGGTLTLFASALDERIKVAVVSGYLTTLYEQTFVRGDTCGQQIVPGLLQWGELADLACLIAPRALLVESGTEDQGFGIAAARQACAEVKRLYEVLDIPEKMAQHVFEGGHRWDGTRTVPWLRQWL
jgi:dienelactone hydrolase